MALFATDGALVGANTLAIAAITALVAIHFYSGIKVHPKEPKVVRPWIPVVGHLIGMALQGGRYTKRLGLKYIAEPIFTLPVPGSRLYIVTDPSLAAAVQRASKTLSMTPLLPHITQRVLGLDDHAAATTAQNMDPEPGQPGGYLSDISDMTTELLGPGTYLNELSIDAVRDLSQQIVNRPVSLNRQDPGAQTVDLLDWIRRFVTFGSADLLFGPENPLKHKPELEEAFWAFDHGLGGLLVGVFPSWTASQAYQGREKCVAAFKEYYANGQHKQASKIIRERYRIERNWSVSDDTIARSALSFLFAGIVNTTTTTYWAVIRIFSDSELLAIVRAEMQSALTKSRELHGEDCLSVAQVKDACPTLMAVYRECLRLGSENFSVRLVKEDMVLNERYYLKKGGVVQIAGGTIHANKDIWGEDVDDFNPQRFSSKQRGGGNSIHPAAFRGFGGGKTLCPGRHFATNEIICFTAIIARYFDLSAADGGQIRVPEKNDMVMPVHILEPKISSMVNIRARPEEEELSRLQVVV